MRSRSCRSDASRYALECTSVGTYAHKRGEPTVNPARVSVELSLTLMPPTPPSAHVEFSKNQIVVELSVMGTSKVVMDVPLFAGRTPVSKPFSDELWSCSGTHGASNSD